VVALNDSALRARVDARLLRAQARELRVAARGNVVRTHERVARAHVEADKAREQRLEPLPSPWSELPWTQADGTLEQTLVPLP
jgi:hypothetical protein